MRLLPGAASLAAAFLPTAAQAQGCDLWSRARPGATAYTAAISIAAMDEKGRVVLARGPVQFIPGVGPNGGPLTSSWSTPADSPARRVYSDMPSLAGPGGSLAPRREAMTVLITRESGETQMRITIGIVLRGGRLTPAFKPTCSANGVWHGSAGGQDFLVRIIPPT